MKTLTLEHKPNFPLAQAIIALRRHWPEYLMEAWELATFMLLAALVVTLLESPGSPLYQALPDPDLRRLLTGVAMGLTAIAIIYSPWGQQSGAHFNPAVTLTFLRLGKVKPWDAVFYILAQFGGGVLGVWLAAAILGERFTAAPVNYIATLPGAGGSIAFAAEFAISFALMLTVLWVSNSERLMRLAGVCAGILVAIFITVEAPLSGMSMNPARSFASAAPGAYWAHLWLYFTAPLLGMLAAAEVWRRTRPPARCAKLDHAPHKRCIHCGYEPPGLKP